MTDTSNSLKFSDYKKASQGIDWQGSRTAFSGKWSSMHPSGLDKMVVIMAVFISNDKVVPFRYLCIHQVGSETKDRLQPFI